MGGGTVKTPEQIATWLTDAQKQAMLFFDGCDLPEAENKEERVMISDLMRLGLVGQIIMEGHMFMDCSPLGLSVRAILKEQADVK